MSNRGIRDAFRTYLRSKTAVTDVVDARIYHEKIPQGVTDPVISYFVVSNPRDYTSSGQVNVSTAHFQVVAWSEVDTEADELAEILRNVYSGFRGVFGTVKVRAVFLDDEGDEFTAPIDADDKGVFGVRHDLRISYEETVPSLITP